MKRGQESRNILQRNVNSRHHLLRSGQPRVCILAYSEVSRDARVLRQVEHLATECEVVVGGWGQLSLPGVRFQSLPRRFGRLTRFAGYLLLLLGRVWPPAYRLWFRLRPYHAEAVRLAERERCDVYYANDWVTLPAAWAGARKHGGKLVFDAHEYSPLEWESSARWRFLYRPFVLSVLREFGPRVDAAITVSQPIANRYAAEYPFTPVVILNAPAVVDPPPPVSPPDDGHLRLVHHGSAVRERRMERMIDALALAGDRFTLDLMLVGDAAYIRALARRAEARAPGRVRLREPVAPRDIVGALAAYDLGFYLLDSGMFNHAMAMPNKIFDFVAAGLGVVIGPSPAMRELAERYGFGRAAESNDAAAVARLLDSLTAADVQAMKAASLRARSELNANVEMAKLRALVRGLAAKPVAG